MTAFAGEVAMASEQPIFMVSFPSHLAYVPCARIFFEGVAKAYGVEPTVIQTVALALHEALTNVVRHGHRHEVDLTVQMQVHFGEDRLEVHILDEGPPFDVNKVPELDPTELRVGGRGVYLMRTILDEVASHPRADRGNVLRLVKHCAPKKPAPVMA